MKIRREVDFHMGEQLTESDVKKIKEEIEYRKIVVRKKELERKPYPLSGENA